MEIGNSVLRGGKVTNIRNLQLIKSAFSCIRVYMYVCVCVHYFIGEKSVLKNNTMLNLHDKITMIKRQHSIPQIFLRRLCTILTWRLL